MLAILRRGIYCLEAPIGTTGCFCAVRCSTKRLICDSRNADSTATGSQKKRYTFAIPSFALEAVFLQTQALSWWQFSCKPAIHLQAFYIYTYNILY